MTVMFMNPVMADETEITPATTKESEKTCEALFVHNAKSSVMDGNTLIMKNFSPTVVFFCDRPVRMAGNLTVQEFLDSVSTGTDSFKDNPPNAVLSVMDGDEIVDIVVKLTKKPQIVGDYMIYKDVQIIEGEPVKTAGISSLFIDVIGRPMSPTSVAGRHRRHRRRVIMRH